MNDDKAGILTAILVVGGICCVMIFAMMGTPSSPYNAFQKDNTLVEYCYMNITGVEDNPVRQGMEVRIEKVYNYHEECVDRNLNITSVGDGLTMETKQFGNYAIQSRVYVKFSGNGTGGLKYGDLL